MPLILPISSMKHNHHLPPTQIQKTPMPRPKRPPPIPPILQQRPRPLPPSPRIQRIPTQKFQTRKFIIFRPARTTRIHNSPPMSRRRLQPLRPLRDPDMPQSFPGFLRIAYHDCFTTRRDWVHHADYKQLLQRLVFWLPGTVSSSRPSGVDEIQHPVNGADRTVDSPLSLIHIFDWAEEFPGPGVRVLIGARPA